MEPKDKTLTFIDLFSGCGGLSIGFEMTGFTSVFACDFWPPACLTFRRNFPHCPLYDGDVKELNQEKLKQFIGKTDVIVGGPPCQGFSFTGKQWVDDPRNRLFVEFIRVISLVKPKYVVMENVPPILTLASGKFAREISVTYNQAGYQVKANILNARYYGVPQERRRAVFLAWRDELPEPNYPISQALPYVTCKDDDYDKFYQSFREKLAGIDTRLGMLQDAEDNYYITAKYLLDLTKKVYELFISSEVEERRQLLKFILQNPKVDGKKVQFQLQKPFDTLLNFNNHQLGLRLIDIFSNKEIEIPSRLEFTLIQNKEVIKLLI